MTTSVLQIIPSPPNQSDGIGDYALLLAEQLQQQHQIKTHFLVFRNDARADFSLKSKPSTARLYPFQMTRLSTHSMEALVAAVPSHIDAILLHFSAYPYFHNNLRGTLGMGTPFWFVEGLENLMRTRQLNLVVMFHELPKLYWRNLHTNKLNPVHSLVSRRLAILANSVMTNTASYQALLTQWTGKPVLRLGIFSNVGEPATMLPLSHRRPRLVVFGGSARRRVYGNACKRLVQACQSLKLEEIQDVGTPLSTKERPSLESVRFREAGFQPDRAISHLLCTSVAGCLDYTPFPGDLSKSSVLAAYCAHGVVPILTRYNPSEADGLRLNEHYLALDRWQPRLTSEGMQTIANNAHRWYQTHSVQEVTHVFARKLLVADVDRPSFHPISSCPEGVTPR
jgi:hypothetical protein